MPFYLSNEHIEATLERNPDDTFHPSDMNQSSSTQKTTIKQLISQEIKNTFEKYTLKEVESGKFCNVESFKEDMGLTYLFTFETDNDEYEMIYHLPSRLVAILEQYSKDGIEDKTIVANKEIFLNVSNSIITCLNAQQDFAFLQNIELIDLCNQTVDYEKIKIIKNLYSLTISIDKKEYEFYLQLDNQFNKTF